MFGLKKSSDAKPRSHANVAATRAHAGYAFCEFSTVPIRTSALVGDNYHEVDDYIYNFDGSWFEVIRMAQTLRVIPSVLGGILAAPASNKLHGYVLLERVEENALLLAQTYESTSDEARTRVDDLKVDSHVADVHVEGDIEQGGMIIAQGDDVQVHVRGSLKPGARVLVVGNDAKIVVHNDVSTDAVALAVGTGVEVAVLGSALRDATVEAHGVRSRVAVAAMARSAHVHAVHETDGVSVGIES